MSRLDRTPIMKEIGPRMPATLELAVLAVLLSGILAVPLAVLVAVKQVSLLDYRVSMVTCASMSIPMFVTGLMGVSLLVRRFHWVPPLGYATLWEAPWTNLQHMTFPTLALAVFALNVTAWVTRSAMLEVLREDAIRPAHAMGIAERWIRLRQALNAAA
jgi:peptide/nickel transport system permease protein